MFSSSVTFYSKKNKRTNERANDILDGINGNRSVEKKCTIRKTQI